MKNRELLLSRRIGISRNSIEALISHYSVISFGIFDTLLCRKVWAASDVFQYLERRHGQTGFAQARVKAEWLARRRFKIGDAVEITLEQIYLILADLAPTLKVTAKMELTTESKFLVRDPSICLLIDFARQQGKRVIGISDMYLSASQISNILVEEGIELDALYSSSDYRKQGLGKFNRRMFVHVAKTEGVEISEILHFGGNPQADVANANAMGVTGMLVQSRRDYIASNPPPFSAKSAPDLTSSLIASQVALKTPFMDADEPPLYTFGYAMGGPLLIGFCLYILDRAKKDGVNHLNLLTRDGYVIEKALDILGTEGISYSIMPMSRRMAIFPILSENREFVEQHFLQELNGSQTPRNFWKQLELDPEDLDGHVDIDLPMAPGQFLAKFHDALTKASAAECKALKTHLAEWIGDRAKTTALVDIGWSLSTFRALDTIFESKFPAYFVGIAQAGYHRKGLYGYLFDRGKPDWVVSALSPGLDLIEILFSDQSPEYGRVVLNDDKAMPECQPVGTQDILRNSAVGEVRRGILDFVRDIAWAKDDLDNEELTEFNRKMFARVISSPRSDEYSVFANMPHARTSGHTDWATTGHFWRQPASQSSPSEQFLVDSEQVRLLLAFGDLLPSDIKELAKNDKLDAMDWRKEFRSNPLRVSRWSAIRRYQRRVKQRHELPRKGK